MRQHLQLNQAVDLKNTVNSWLFEYYQAAYEADLQITALNEALFYALQCQSADTAINWCLEQITHLQEKSQHQTVVSLLQFLNDPTPKRARIITTLCQWDGFRGGFRGGFSLIVLYV